MTHRARRRLSFFFGATVILALAIFSFLALSDGYATSRHEKPGDAAATPDTPRVPVEVVEARQGPISSIISSSSTLEAEQTAQVLAKVEGLITEVRVKEGDSIRTGYVLATVDDEEKQLALDKAKLKLGKAQAEYERAKLSFEQQLLSKHDYDKALFERELAVSDLKTAELELAYTQVRAPFAGRVTEKRVVVGKTVKKADHLFTLADFASLIATNFLPEKDVFRLERGQRVELSLESLPDSNFEGRIRDIGPVVDPKTGTVKVTIAVVDGSPFLRPGAFVRINIITATHVDAVLVPKAALVREDGDEFVYLAVDGMAVKRPVRLGYASNGLVEIVDGVQAGQQVVIAGQSNVADDSRLQILN